MRIIQPAEPCHLPAILDNYNDAITHTTAVFITEPVDLQNRTDWFENRRKDGFPVLVLMEGGKLLGYASYGTFRAFSGYKHTAELSIYIAAHARGTGAGDLLMGALLTAAKQQQIHTLIGAVEAENLASIRLHEKHGFSATVRLAQVGWKFDRWLDLIFMHRLL